MLTAWPYWCWHRLEEFGTKDIEDDWLVSERIYREKCGWTLMFKSIVPFL